MAPLIVIVVIVGIFSVMMTMMKMVTKVSMTMAIILHSFAGHTEGYLATMEPEEISQQFPAFRMPIVAAFDWRGPAAAKHEVPVAQSHIFRI